MTLAERTGRREAMAMPAALHAAYRLLAWLFLSPDQERFATLVVAVPELRSILWPLANLPCAGALDHVLGQVEALDDDGVDRLRTDHTTLFLSGTRDHAVQPYESWHVGAGDYEHATVSGALSTRYREAGLAVGIVGQLPDHVAVELEFCAYLCHQEGDAEAEESVRRWQRERHTFLVAHPLRWLIAFEHALAASRPDSLYVDFARTARLVASDDRLLLDIMQADDLGRYR